MLQLYIYVVYRIDFSFLKLQGCNAINYNLATLRNLNQFVLLFVGMLLVNLVSAQKAEAPNFKYGGNIKKMMLTATGVLLITHGNGLAGIKAGQGGLVFNFNDYGKVKEGGLSIIPNNHA